MPETPSQTLGRLRDTMWKLLADLEAHSPDEARWPDLEAALRLTAREAERCQEGIRHAAIFASSATEGSSDANH